MNTQRRSAIAFAIAAASLCCTNAFAQQHGTKDEAKALNDAAVAHIKKVGLEQAVKDFGSRPCALDAQGPVSIRHGLWRRDALPPERQDDRQGDRST